MVILGVSEERPAVVPVTVPESLTAFTWSDSVVRDRECSVFLANPNKLNLVIHGVDTGCSCTVVGRSGDTSLVGSVIHPYETREVSLTFGGSVGSSRQVVTFHWECGGHRGSTELSLTFEVR